jgi:hypothetical protein
MPDFEARRTAVSRFFDPQASADERWGIIAQYRVTHVLVLKSEVRQLEELLTPGLRLVYSDDYYELRAVCETERIPSPEPAPGRPGLDSSAGRGLPITGR